MFGFDTLHAFFNQAGDFMSQDMALTADRAERLAERHPGASGDMPKLHRDGNTVTIDLTPVPPDGIRECAEPIYFGTPIEPLNWGMWLLQAVPSAADYVAAGMPGRFGCWFKLGWQQRLLAAMGIPDHKLLMIDEWAVYATDRLTFRAHPTIEFFVGPGDRETFAAIARRCPPLPVPPDRIFISRIHLSEAGSARRLLNEAELADALVAIGFVVVAPETLPFEEQVALFASASVIVGLGGAGLFNAVFARPRTKLVTIEASTAFIHNHANLFSSLDLDYAVVFGARVPGDARSPHHDWTLDVPRTVAEIRAFIA